MDMQSKQYLDQLVKGCKLTHAQFAHLIGNRSEASSAYAQELAAKAKASVYGTKVFVRGLIEISNYCKNDCLYCGIRCSNRSCDRYRLTKDQILDCAAHGYAMGMRTFVMQGGEDPKIDDAFLCDVVRRIKAAFPDCAVTLSVGERPRESYEALRQAGADRYLLRHETANQLHYERLHPGKMSFATRMECLATLKDLGFAVGCGFMVGSPYQVNDDLASDLMFVQEFQPEMCGIGPFIPHEQTPFANEPSGSVDLTCFLLSLLRLIKPNLLLPATTALGTLSDRGWEIGLLAGANVLMPNLSPQDCRERYKLYDGKEVTGIDSRDQLCDLRNRLAAVGHELVVDRGDPAE